MDYRTEIRVRAKGGSLSVSPPKIKSEHYDLEIGETTVVELSSVELELINMHRNAIRELTEIVEGRSEE